MIILIDGFEFNWSDIMVFIRYIESRSRPYLQIKEIKKKCIIIKIILAKVKLHNRIEYIDHSFKLSDETGI